MPPKAQDDGTKDAKNLQLLLACIKSVGNTVVVNYDELVKLDDAPSIGALQKRVGRMGKAFGVSIKAVSSNGEAKKKAAVAGPAVTKAKPAPKKPAGSKKAVKKVDKDDEDTSDNDEAPPVKKPKLEQTSENDEDVKVEENEADDD